MSNVIIPKVNESDDDSHEGSPPVRPPRPPSASTSELFSLECRRPAPAVSDSPGRPPRRSLSFDRTPPGPMTLSGGPGSRGGTPSKLPTPPGPMTLSGGPGSRGGTPSKLRKDTPESKRTGSALRSGSASRAQSAGRVNLAKAVFDAQRANHIGSTRHVSRRKLRKWENDRMVQSSRILQQNALLARMARGEDVGDGDNSDDDLDQEWDSAISSLQIDIRTQFAPLFEAGNEKYLDLFRHSYSGSVPSSGADATYRRARRDEWQAAEAAWINRVEKRLRSVCEKCVRDRSDLKILDFLQTLEVLLLLFAETGAAPDRASTLPVGPFSAMLVKPLEVVEVSEDVYRTRPRSRKDRSNEQQEERPLVPSLSICLQDSSLHRLVLHAAAQFYGMKSFSEPKSTCSSTRGAQGGDVGMVDTIPGRVTRVALPKVISAKKNPMLVEKVSLAAYLQAAVEVGNGA